MTISAEIPELIATAAPGQTVFAFDFRLFQPGDIDVFVDRTLAVYTPAPLVVLEYDLTILALPAEGGSITFGDPMVGGEVVEIFRAVPIERATNFPPSGPVPMDAINLEFDRHIAIMQDLDAGVSSIQGRALMVPAPETVPTLPPASERAQGILGFDADGNPIILPSEELGSVAVVAQRRELVAVAGQTIFQTNATYTVGYVSVYVNGVRLSEQEYTATDGVNVVLDEPCLAGDIVVLEGFLGSATAGDAASLTFIQAGAGAVSRNAQDKMRERVSAKDFGARGDGVTDDRAAFLTADALGAFMLPPGLYRIGSNLTITNRVSFAAGARLVIPAGVTVTFNGEIEAGPRQIFNLTGTGAVLGLREGHAQWFCGDISKLSGQPAPTVDCTALMTKAFAAVGDGILYDSPVIRLHAGTAFIDVAAASYDGGRVTYLWAGTSRLGIRIAYSGFSGWVKNFILRPLIPGTQATAGEAVYIGRGTTSVTDFEVWEPYIGVLTTQGASIYIQRFAIYGAYFIGWRNNTIDVYVSDFVIQALNDLVTVSGITGTFNPGDKLTIGGGGNNDLTAKYDATRWAVFALAKPVAGQIVTSSSGGSATIASVAIGHAVGAIRWEGNGEALNVSNGDVLGGDWALIMVGGGTAGRTGNPAFCSINDTVYFDTSYSGAQIDGAYGCQINAWFSNPRTRGSNGIVLFRCGGDTKISARIAAARAYGMIIDQTCSNVDISGTEFMGNCGAYDPDPAMAELRFLGHPTRITASNISGGFTALGATPPRFITVDADVSDYIKLSYVSCPITAGMVTWGSTGTHNRRTAVDSIADL